jgi:hypothetical protein
MIGRGTTVSQQLVSACHTITVSHLYLGSVLCSWADLTLQLSEQCVSPCSSNNVSQVMSTLRGTNTLESRFRGIEANLLLDALLRREAADSGLEAGYIRIDFFDLSPGIIDSRISWYMAWFLSDAAGPDTSAVAF